MTTLYLQLIDSHAVLSRYRCAATMQAHTRKSRIGAILASAQLLRYFLHQSGYTAMLQRFSLRRSTAFVTPRYTGWNAGSAFHLSGRVVIMIER